MSQDFEDNLDHVEENPDIAQETPAAEVFIAPSIDKHALLAGQSYSYFSELPPAITENPATACVLGVDEAGRGPVLGPMVYSAFYLPITSEKPLLTETHHFDDSKVLTPTVRSNLMQNLCTRDTALYNTCGWTARILSARDIAAGMLKASGAYNLNAQAMDATIDLIKEVFARGVNIQEIYIDTIGSPIVYQKKLERIFPTTRITVAKKADSLYPCVSAASVCAKVTRDAALEVCYESYSVQAAAQGETAMTTVATNGWGSGYPSDGRCVSWMKQNMDPIFGWGPECRFSWGTAKDLLEGKNTSTQVDWPVEDDDEDMKVTSFFASASQSHEPGDALTDWFGRKVTEQVF